MYKRDYIWYHHWHWDFLAGNCVPLIIWPTVWSTCYSTGPKSSWKLGYVSINQTQNLVGFNKQADRFYKSCENAVWIRHDMIWKSVSYKSLISKSFVHLYSLAIILWPLALITLVDDSYITLYHIFQLPLFIISTQASLTHIHWTPSAGHPLLWHVLSSSLLSIAPV